MRKRERKGGVMEPECELVTATDCLPQELLRTILLLAGKEARGVCQHWRTTVDEELMCGLCHRLRVLQCSLCARKECACGAYRCKGETKEGGRWRRCTLVVCKMCAVMEGNIFDCEYCADTYLCSQHTLLCSYCNDRTLCKRCACWCDDCGQPFCDGCFHSPCACPRSRCITCGRAKKVGSCRDHESRLYVCCEDCQFICNSFSLL